MLPRSNFTLIVRRLSVACFTVRYVASASVRNKLFGGFARFQPPLGRAEARMTEAFVLGVSAKRLAQRFVSGAWLCRMY